LAALLVGIMLFLFVLTIYVPNLINNPGDRFAITVPLRDLALSGGALALAGVLGSLRHGQSARWLLQLGRWFEHRTQNGQHEKCSPQPLLTYVKM
jgi:hypothetical protein